LRKAPPLQQEADKPKLKKGYEKALQKVDSEGSEHRALPEHCYTLKCRLSNLGYITMSTLQDRFEYIYAANIWGHGSGGGSSPINTRGYRRFLQNFLRKNNIKSVVDLGCGDWQFSHLIDWKGIRYSGFDVGLSLNTTAMSIQSPK
jgi:hypothetical protein